MLAITLKCQIIFVFLVIAFLNQQSYHLSLQVYCNTGIQEHCNSSAYTWNPLSIRVFTTVPFHAWSTVPFIACNDWDKLFQKMTVQIQKKSKPPLPSLTQETDTGNSNLASYCSLNDFDLWELVPSAGEREGGVGWIFSGTMQYQKHPHPTPLVIPI